MAKIDIRRGRRVTVREGGVRTDSRTIRVSLPEYERRSIPISEESLLRKSLIRESPQWHVIHKRGVRRPTVGQDPLEARAVSESAVRGFAHERVVYRWLTWAGFQPGVDFEFQSSQEGGRLDIGGMVVDFIFPQMKIALGVDGPTHMEELRGRKDEEQEQLLSEMGYWSLHVTTVLIADQVAFERQMAEWFLQGMTTTTSQQTARDPVLERELDAQRLLVSTNEMESAIVRLEQWY